MLLLKSLTSEFQSPAVLSHRAHDGFGNATGNLRVNFQRHCEFSAGTALKMRDDLVGNLARVQPNCLWGRYRGELLLRARRPEFGIRPYFEPSQEFRSV